MDVEWPIMVSLIFIAKEPCEGAAGVSDSAANDPFRNFSVYRPKNLPVTPSIISVDTWDVGAPAGVRTQIGIHSLVLEEKTGVTEVAGDDS